MFFIDSGGSKTVTSLDVETGEDKWVYESDVSFAGLSIADGTVHLGGKYIREDSRGRGVAVAIDAMSGEYEWDVILPSRYAYNDDYEGFDEITAETPVVADGNVYVPSRVTDVNPTWFESAG